MPLTVDLGEPVGDSKQVDGACLVIDAVAAGYGEYDAVRWTLEGPSVRGRSSSP
ncbi:MULTISPECIES: hypothetical protein [unclassified Arthrobacter]|uniref:hypothetical protein n=1 Tax=unclassified Arthrobacter TaxID=235627 RepID=UPI001492332F|nr:MULTISPECIES: hypothetical protein [unclassified Arthrobacter]NOJ64704.1 hypothetical protein [Arthrobacter sp. 147(2020)]